MAELQLPFAVEYVTTKEACAARSRATDTAGLNMVGEQYAVTVLIVLPALALAVMQSMNGGVPMAAAFIVISCVGLIFTLWYWHRQLGKALKAAHSTGAGEPHRLEFTSEGMTEHDRGIVSFCPWHAMKNYCIDDGVLLVELANHLWAIIPGSTLEPQDVTLAQLGALLAQHGVQHRPAALL